MPTMPSAKSDYFIEWEQIMNEIDKIVCGANANGAIYVIVPHKGKTGLAIT